MGLLLLLVLEGSGKCEVKSCCLSSASASYYLRQGVSKDYSAPCMKMYGLDLSKQSHSLLRKITACFFLESTGKYKKRTKTELLPQLLFKKLLLEVSDSHHDSNISL